MWRRLTLTCALASGLLGPARAEAAPPAEDQELSLSTFVKEVEQQNPAVDAAALAEHAARIRVRPARSSPDPFVAVGIDEVALSREMAEDGSMRWPRPVIRYQVNQTFPIERKLRARGGAVSAIAEVVSADVQVLQRNLHVAAVQLFVQALYLQSAIATSAKLREMLDDVIASAEARYVTGGPAAHHEVLRATAERAVHQRDALVLQRELTDLRAEMNELRGLAPDLPAPRLVDDGSSDPLVPPSRTTAFVDQPELREAEAMIHAADARVEVARTVGLPDFAVQVMAMQSLTPGMPSGLGAMVGVTVPIFWRSKQGPGIDAAQVDRQAAARRRDALRLRLESEWDAAERAYRTSLDTLALYEADVLPALRAALDSSEAAYVTQQVPLSELLDILRATLAAELEYEASQLDVRLARLRLEQLVASPAVLRLAPTSPTLFGSGMGGGMSADMAGRGMSSRAMRMSEGMRPPTLDLGDDVGVGTMGGM